MWPMKIIENSPQRLIVDHVPWGLLASLLGFMSIWVAGSVMFILNREPGGAVILLALGTLLPMGAVWLLVHRNQFVMDTSRQTAELRRRDFRGFTKQSFPLGSIERAYVAQDTPRLGSLFIQVRDGMDAGHHRFMATNAKLPDVQGVADAINDWLGEHRLDA